MVHVLKVRGRIRRSRGVQGTDVALDPGKDASVRGKGRSSIPMVLSVTLMTLASCRRGSTVVYNGRVYRRATVVLEDHFKGSSLLQHG